MSIPGVDLENGDPVEPEHVEDPNLSPAEDEGADDSVVETVTVGERKMVPLAEVIKYRKAAKAAEKRLAEQQTQIDTVSQQLDAVAPYVEKLREPGVMAKLNEATAPSRTAEHDTEDTEAIQHAQDYGLIDAKGELDIARARRQLNALEKMAERKAEAIAQRIMGPLARNSAEQKALSLREQAKRATTKDGQGPLATEESVDLAYKLLPPELIAAEGVAPIANILAAGLDVYYGRRPGATREYAEPIYTETGRSRGPSPLSSDEKRIIEKVGLDEKTFRTAGANMERAAATRRGVALE